jgi:hypothetical protein
VRSGWDRSPHVITSYTEAQTTLDSLMEIAHAIYIDYFSSPEFYQGENAPEKIVDRWLS